MDNRIKIEVECANCGIIFLKAKTEITRKSAIGKKHYCSLKCHGKANHAHLKPYYGQGNIKEFSNHQKDEFTGFREFLRRIKMRRKENLRGTDLTLQYLKDLFDKQDGKCIYSKVDLILPSYKNKSSNPLYTASLDRIDSSKGYIEGNVQFISIAMNHMKNNMTHEQTLELLRIIKTI